MFKHSSKIFLKNASRNNIQSVLILKHNNVAYSFGSRNNLDLAPLSSISKLHQIKLWSLQDLLSRSIDEHLQSFVGQSKKQLNSEAQDIEAFEKYIKKNSNDAHSHIVINRYFSTIQYLPKPGLSNKYFSHLSNETINKKKLYFNLISVLEKHRNWNVIPHYQSIIYNHQLQNFQGLKLFIGDFNDSFLNNYPRHSYITLQQYCALYPQKIPLSYRGRSIAQKTKKVLQIRINNNRADKINFDHQPKITQIVVINDKIKMWDEAIQVILDQLPVKISIPFYLTQPTFQFYRLNLIDFINSFLTTKKLIHPDIHVQIDQPNLLEFLKRILIQNNPKTKPTANINFQIEIMDPELRKQEGQKISILL